MDNVTRGQAGVLSQKVNFFLAAMLIGSVGFSAVQIILKVANQQDPLARVFINLEYSPAEF